MPCLSIRFAFFLKVTSGWWFRTLSFVACSCKIVLVSFSYWIWQKASLLSIHSWRKHVFTANQRNDDGGLPKCFGKIPDSTLKPHNVALRLRQFVTSSSPVCSVKTCSGKVLLKFAAVCDLWCWCTSVLFVLWTNLQIFSFVTKLQFFFTLSDVA